jgi:soluble P-type ATPase
MGLDIDIPGFGAFQFQHVLFDLNGTLGLDGVIADTTRAQLITLGQTLTLHVMTADTHGTLDRVVEGLPLDAQRVQGTLGAEEKRALVMALGATHTIAVGNGRNDVAMLRAAALGIAVLGVEGIAVDALQAADVLFPHINAALDSLLNPLRLIATLRG